MIHSTLSRSGRRPSWGAPNREADIAPWANRLQLLPGFRACRDLLEEHHEASYSILLPRAPMGERNIAPRATFPLPAYKRRRKAELYTRRPRPSTLQDAISGISHEHVRRRCPALAAVYRDNLPFSRLCLGESQIILLPYSVGRRTPRYSAGTCVLAY